MNSFIALGHNALHQQGQFYTHALDSLAKELDQAQKALEEQAKQIAELKAANETLVKELRQSQVEAGFFNNPVAA